MNCNRIVIERSVIHVPPNRQIVLTTTALNSEVAIPALESLLVFRYSQRMLRQLQLRAPMKAMQLKRSLTCSEYQPTNNRSIHVSPSSLSLLYSLSSTRPQAASALGEEHQAGAALEAAVQSRTLSIAADRQDGSAEGADPPQQQSAAGPVECAPAVAVGDKGQAGSYASVQHLP